MVCFSSKMGHAPLWILMQEGNEAKSICRFVFAGFSSDIFYATKNDLA